MLGKYSTVIWAGNDYQGDLADWQQTSILPYLDAGGNVILIARKGKDFLTYGKDGYLGVTLDSLNKYIWNCLSTHSDLDDMEFLADQDQISVFDTTLAGEESTLLFKTIDYFGKEWGLGVWKKPATGGSIRPEGGQFVFISGRPYRYEWNQLSSNIDVILADFFNEVNPSGTEERSDAVMTFRLEQNYPNPFNSSTSIRYELPLRTHLTLKVFNLLGQEIHTLIDMEKPAGTHTAIWDGRDAFGRDVPSGVYFFLMQCDSFVSRRKTVLMR